MTKKKAYKIAIFGPQGSGKGTQAEMLSKKYKIPAISTGEILRQEISKGSALGRQIKKYVLAGKLGPVELINAVMKKRLAKKDALKGFILDGYPRSMEQAEFLNKKTELGHAVLIDIPKAEIVKRLSDRRTCPKCGAIYSLRFKRPKKRGICDKCKSELIQRDDEKPAAIKERLKIFYRDTRPVIAYYRKKGQLIRINGQKSIKEVQKDIIKSLAR